MQTQKANPWSPGWSLKMWRHQLLSCASTRLDSKRELKVIQGCAEAALRMPERWPG